MDMSTIRRGKSSSVKQPVKQKTLVDSEIPVRTNQCPPSLSKTKTSIVDKKQVSDDDYSNDFEASNSFAIKPAGNNSKPKNPLDLF